MAFFGCRIAQIGQGNRSVAAWEGIGGLYPLLSAQFMTVIRIKGALVLDRTRQDLFETRPIFNK